VEVWSPDQGSGDQTLLAGKVCGLARAARLRVSLPGMSEWVTQREAAELLGVHVSLVPKMVRLGDLTPRATRPSLSRDQVVALATTRKVAAEERERRNAVRPAGPQAPDDRHEWLLSPATAAVLGCSVVAIRARAVRGRVPSMLSGGRRWFRLDHLELVVRAEAARRLRRVAG
jgi:hypothetical protein